MFTNQLTKVAFVLCLILMHWLGSYAQHQVSTQAIPHAQLSIPMYTTQQAIASNTLCAQRTMTANHAKVRFSMGAEEYNYGTNAFSSSVNFTLTGLDIGNMPVFTKAQSLSINQGKPEMVFVHDYSASYPQVVNLQITINGYTPPGIGQADIQLELTTYEEYTVDVSSESVNLVAVNGSSNPVTFSWSPSCKDIPGYEFQLQRLYNKDKNYTSQTDIMAYVDWSTALSLWTESSDTSITLTLSEGTGFYLWRVRPIGDSYERGINDERNWGSWSSHHTSGTMNFNTGSLTDDVFYYTQFDADKNFIHSRSFSEGLKSSEGMAYANGLNNVRQQQAQIKSKNKVMVNQSLQDYTGRNAFNTLGVPVDQNYFSYRDTLIQQGSNELYTVDHFDADGNYKNPLTVDHGAIQDYYSNDNPDLQVPNAEGYPFARKIFYSDIMSRVKETGNPGMTHRLVDQPGVVARTNRLAFASVEDIELVRIFGDEAPNVSSIIKTISIDQNSTPTVTYQDKQGQTIATCLSVTSADDHMQSLPSEVDAGFTVNGKIDSNVQVSEHELKAVKRYFFTESTDITIDYTITPQVIQSSCGLYCSSCDYLVDLFVYDLDDTSATKQYTLWIPPTPCGQQTSRDTTIQVTLDADKTYLIERRIRTANIVPGSVTTSTPQGITYRQYHMDSVRKKLVTDYSSDIDTLMSYLDKADLAGFYSYLTTHHSYDTSDTEVTIGSCFKVDIPKEECDTQACGSGTPDFEALLSQVWPDKWAATPNLNGFFRWDGFATYPASTTYPEGNGAFNALISNMINDGYSCEKLWQCWYPLVLNYNELAYLDTGLQRPNDDFNLLQSFIKCAAREQWSTDGWLQWFGLYRRRKQRLSGSGSQVLLLRIGQQ